MIFLDSVLTMEEPIWKRRSLMNPAESKDFRYVAGCVGYMAIASRCDLFVEASMLGRSFLRNCKFAPTVLSAKKQTLLLPLLKKIAMFYLFNLAWRTSSFC